MKTMRNDDRDAHEAGELGLTPMGCLYLLGCLAYRPPDDMTFSARTGIREKFVAMMKTARASGLTVQEEAHFIGLLKAGVSPVDETVEAHTLHALCEKTVTLLGTQLWAILGVAPTETSARA